MVNNLCLTLLIHFFLIYFTSSGMIGKIGVTHPETASITLLGSSFQEKFSFMLSKDRNYFVQDEGWYAAAERYEELMAL